jgi:hypothetical protein
MNVPIQEVSELATTKEMEILRHNLVRERKRNSLLLIQLESCNMASTEAFVAVQDSDIKKLISSSEKLLKNVMAHLSRSDQLATKSGDKESELLGECNREILNMKKFVVMQWSKLLTQLVKIRYHLRFCCTDALNVSKKRLEDLETTLESLQREMKHDREELSRKSKLIVNLRSERDTDASKIENLETEVSDLKETNKRFICRVLLCV